MKRNKDGSLTTTISLVSPADDARIAAETEKLKQIPMKLFIRDEDTGEFIELSKLSPI